MRVYEFAKELGKDSGDLLEELNGNFGFEIKSHLSGISEEQMEKVRLAYEPRKALKDQIEDSHTKDLEEKFNTGVGICADEKMVNIAVDNQIAKTYKKKDVILPKQEENLVEDVVDSFFEKPEKTQKVEIEKSLFVRFINWFKGK